MAGIQTALIFAGLTVLNSFLLVQCATGPVDPFAIGRSTFDHVWKKNQSTPQQWRGMTATYQQWRGMTATYQAPRKEGRGESMGVMYTLSIWASSLLLSILQKAWVFFLIAAICFLPFGQNRTHCDYQRPSMLMYLVTRCGFPHTCRGEGVNCQNYNLVSFSDDFAWTLYVLELGCWFYIFFITVYIPFLLVGFLILWVMVALTAIVVLTFAAGMACAAVGGAACNDACDCCAADGGAACEDTCGCWDRCMGNFGTCGEEGLTDGIFYNSPWPYDPFWGDSGYGHMEPFSRGGDKCSCCTYACRPIALLMHVMSSFMPQNMWGGLVGYCMGTHTRNRLKDKYQGGNSMIELLGMGCRRTADLHNDDSWRRQVHDFLYQEGAGVSPSDRPLIIVCRPVIMCFESDFQDYKSNVCCICQDAGEKWGIQDISNHEFSKRCSSEMLRREMPCPLYRVSSSTAKFFCKYSGNGSIPHSGNGSILLQQDACGQGVVKKSRKFLSSKGLLQVSKGLAMLLAVSSLGGADATHNSR